MDCWLGGLIILRTLTLHGADTTVLRKVVSPRFLPEEGWKPYPEEYPLQHLAVVSWLFRRIKPELVFWVIMLSEIEQDG